MNKRALANTTGWSIILLGLISGYSLGYAYMEFDQTALLKDSILNNLELYQNMAIGIIILLIIDCLVSYTLYKYFTNDNNKISLLSSVLRMTYVFILGIATFHLCKNFNVGELSNLTVNANFELFKLLFSGALIFFGLHLILLGILMKLHRKIPKILWYITLTAGLSYIIIHSLKVTSINLEFANTLEMYLTLPMIVGELGLAIWLLIKGGKVNTK